MAVDTGYDRATMAEGLTAGLLELEQGETPSTPEVKATPEETAPEPQKETPAPEAAEATPTPLVLTEKSIVIDPADGQPKEWGKIKSERMAHADYTKKTQAAAEMRREAEAIKAQFLAAQEQMKLQAQRAQLPQLPDDDPYAVNLKAQQAQLDAIAQYQLTMQQQMQEQLQERELAASRMALEAEEQRLSTAHGLNKREIELVEREYYHRAKNGEQVTLDSIALEHKAYVASLKEEAVKEFKTKHRVTAPASTVSTPGAAAAEEEIKPGTPAMRERMREAVAALMG